MTPGPSVEDLVATVRTDAAGDDPLAQLAAASRAVAELEAVADATLTHFVDQCRRDGRSWSEISRALGVTKQATHKRFSVAPPTLERFTERARAALDAAAEAARALGHNYVGTEHLLLGLFEPARGIAAQVLGEIGITRAAVEERIQVAAPRSPSIVTDPPFTPRAAKSIARALTEALELGHNYIGTEHLLLALFDDPGALAATMLADLGAQRADVESRIVERLSGYVKPSA